MTDLVPNECPDGHWNHGSDRISSPRATCQPACATFGFVKFIGESRAYRTSRSDEHWEPVSLDWNALARSMQLHPLREVVAPVIKVHCSGVNPAHLRDIHDMFVAETVDVCFAYNRRCIAL